MHVTLLLYLLKRHHLTADTFYMPSTSAISAEEKVKIKNAIPASTNKILFATIARIYYAHPQPNKWSYAGLQGGLALAKDKTNNAIHFKLVDLDGTRGVIWEHELYEGLEFYRDRPFFYSFAGDVSREIHLFNWVVLTYRRNA